MYIPKRLLLLVCMAILVTGCASTDKQSSAKDNPVTGGSGVVCTYEKKLGKIIKEKVCYSKRDREIIKESAEDLKRERKSKRM